MVKGVYIYLYIYMSTYTYTYIYILMLLGYVSATRYETSGMSEHGYASYGDVWWGKRWTRGSRGTVQTNHWMVIFWIFLAEKMIHCLQLLSMDWTLVCSVKSKVFLQHFPFSSYLLVISQSYGTSPSWRTVSIGKDRQIHPHQRSIFHSTLCELKVPPLPNERRQLWLRRCWVILDLEIVILGVVNYQ